MKQEPTKEQVLDAMRTNGTVQKAAKALGLSYPKMQHWIKKYSIVCNHNAKQKPVNTGRDDDEHAFRVAINCWYKRFFKKGE